ncbi:MAG: propanediol utilization protein [Paracoccaceae bacterium]|nr:propanediol utilization protein [Paracoccaceae bacterium]
MDKTNHKNETRIARVSGHFGEWLQGKFGENGPVALISVQCPSFWVQVACSSSEAFVYQPEMAGLSADKAQAILAALRILPETTVHARSNTPVGAGLGASTASLVALARAATKRDLGAEVIAKACLSVEGATDPLMYPDFDRLLWASRSGKILARYAPPPKFEVLGGLVGLPQITDPKDNNFPEISDLIKEWPIATGRGFLQEVGDLATESYRRTTTLRDAAPEPTMDLAKDLGAIGIIRAHTGSARGFLFKPGTVPSSGLHRLAEAGYSNATQFITGGNE